jgi:hypothetical protein
MTDCLARGLASQENSALFQVGAVLREPLNFGFVFSAERVRTTESIEGYWGAIEPGAAAWAVLEIRAFET